METTFEVEMRGRDMEDIFIKGGDNLSIRNYRAIGDGYNPDDMTVFEVTVRHPEGTNARTLLAAARAKAKGREKPLGNNLQKTVVAFYLDYLNNFLTVQALADHYGISKENAEKLIEVGKDIHFNGDTNA